VGLPELYSGEQQTFVELKPWWKTTSLTLIPSASKTSFLAFRYRSFYFRNQSGLIFNGTDNFR
jgi:hypothetical protein